MNKDEFSTRLQELTFEALEDLNMATVFAVLTTHLRVLISTELGDEIEDYEDYEADDGGSDRFRIDDDLT